MRRRFDKLYTYDITLINNLDKILKKTGAGIKKIILAKILLQLINNYTNFDDAEENYVELTNQCINLINTEKNNWKDIIFIKI